MEELRRIIPTGMIAALAKKGGRIAAIAAAGPDGPYLDQVSVWSARMRAEANGINSLVIDELAAVSVDQNGGAA